ncbi:hypothetical protein HX788_02170 [Pseudomonas edaphica]|uniref:Uncharacterized protein n=1 Tax=Pseudomonas edaphica TaxID=2006980 RepID=A0A7Y8KF10_9PSED|nr:MULTISPECIES: hypothetical protein [Pseudomonas]NWC46154.1 hypothetical protein [Pseudomonas sp. IPO3747]NWE05881.1 hypothetical protein [Pseudomonas edaphica]NWE85570.1 hypothetical protein [Pseudomonas edaphica]
MFWDYLGMGSLLLMFLSFPLTFCAMYTRLDAAESYLQYSSFIVGCRHTFRNTHFEGRPQRVFSMGLVILIPKVVQWRGMVLVEDVEKIPLHLKCWMVVPTLVTYLSFAGMFISWLFITD